jgi:hypothetical protein
MRVAHGSRSLEDGVVVQPATPRPTCPRVRRGAAPWQPLCGATDVCSSALYLLVVSGYVGTTLPFQPFTLGALQPSAATATPMRASMSRFHMHIGCLTR